MTRPSTKYLFRCQCGEEMRMYSPDRLSCSACNEPMELAAVLKIYPGFGIGRVSTKAYFKYGSVDKTVDNDGEAVV